MTTTERRQLAEAIQTSIATLPPGMAFEDPKDNPLLRAYHRYPTIRKMIDDAPHNTHDDVVNMRVTADVGERVMRWLREHR